MEISLILSVAAASFAGTLFLYLFPFAVDAWKGTRKIKGLKWLSAFSKRAFKQIKGIKCNKVWLFFMIYWPLFGLISAGIILSQRNRKLEHRLLADLIFVAGGLICYLIGMGMSYFREKKYQNMTSSTKASVVAVEMGRGVDNNVVYKPVYKFFAEGAMYRVTSSVGHGTSPVKEGERLTLFYVPGRPQAIYVPKELRYSRYLAKMFCIVGILAVVCGLMAPWLRSV